MLSYIKSLIGNIFRFGRKKKKKKDSSIYPMF